MGDEHVSTPLVERFISVVLNNQLFAVGHTKSSWFADKGSNFHDFSCPCPYCGRRPG